MTREREGERGRRVVGQRVLGIEAAMCHPMGWLMILKYILLLGTHSKIHTDHFDVNKKVATYSVRCTRSVRMIKMVYVKDKLETIGTWSGVIGMIA